MTETATIERKRNRAAELQPAAARAKDDAAMLKAAASLTRDLNAPSEAIYWADMLGSALLGYAALFAAMAYARHGWRSAAASSRYSRSTAPARSFMN